MKNISPQELISIIRLIRVENIGCVTFHKLVSQFGSAENALYNLPNIIRKGKTSLKIPSVSEVEKEISLVLKNNSQIISYKDEDFPPLLKQTDDFPPILFIKGHKHLLKKSGIAVVGSRNASLSAQQAAFEFAQEFGNNGFAVVSGMAKGVDYFAHKGSLEKGTVAFLGAGIDNIYPKENADLYHQIVEQGVIASEFSIGTKPLPENFPKRNRLIAGSTKGVLIVEAAINSGSLITAEIALNLGKDVFAIPGYYKDPLHKGTNQLIKDGAFLAESPMDIIEQLRNTSIVKENNPIASYSNHTDLFLETNDNEVEIIQRKILDVLSYNPVHLKHINYDCSHVKLFTALLELELNGKIIRYSGDKISLPIK